MNRNNARIAQAHRVRAQARVRTAPSAAFVVSGLLGLLLLGLLLVGL